MIQVPSIFFGKTTWVALLHFLRHSSGRTADADAIQGMREKRESD